MSEARHLLFRGGLVEKRYIAVSMGGGETWGRDAFRKQWPPENFFELLRLIREEMSYDGVVLLGTSQDALADGAIKKDPTINLLDLCGKTDILLASAIIKLSKFYLGNDGGLTHIASSLDTPLVAFYGPADPAVYGPYPPRADALAITKNLPCQPCYRSFRYNGTCPHLACLRELAPHDVLTYLRKVDFF